MNETKMLRLLQQVNLSDLRVDQSGIPVPNKTVIEYGDERNGVIDRGEAKKQYARNSPEWYEFGVKLGREAGNAGIIDDKDIAEYLVETTVMHVVKYMQTHAELMIDNDQTASKAITLSDFKKSMDAMDALGFERVHDIVEGDVPLTEMVWMLLESLSSGRYGSVSPVYALGTCATAIAYAFKSKRQQAEVNNLYQHEVIDE